MGSFERFGYVAPMVLNESNGRLLAGHGRLDELKMLQADGKPPPEGIRVMNGEWLAPVVMGVRLGAQAGKAYTIADNRMVELGGWDEPRFVDALISLSNGNLDGTGYDRDDVDQLIRLYRPELLGPEPPEPEIDRAAELQKKWSTELGQLWQIGEHRLLCGDCVSDEDVKRLIQSEHAEISITDPPYNVGMEGYQDSRSPEDYKIFTEAWFALAVANSNHQIITTGTVNLANWFRWFEPHHFVPWIKKNSVSRGRVSMFWCWEPIVFFGKQWKRTRPNDVFEFNTSIQKMMDGESLTGLHPDPKPLSLWCELLRSYSESGDSVYDPFSGSGTTLVACEQLGRKGRGIEISPAYVAVSLERLSQMGLKPKLLNS